MSGEEDKQAPITLSEEIELVVNQGGFNLKGVAITGEDPSESLSNDKETASVRGMKWYPKNDVVSLNIAPLNFSKKQRGKKPTDADNVIPAKITRRHYASKVAEIFDLTGKVSPLTASIKLDLHELVTRKLDWDDCIPEDLRSV